MHVASVLVHEQRNRDTPGSLPGDAPVWPAAHHAANALFAPGRRPLHILDLLQRLATQIAELHADKPLRRRAKDQRRLVPPTMRIAVL